MIPKAATVFCMLVEVLPPEQPDVSLRFLDALRVGYQALRLHTVSHVRLSASAAAMRYDFASLGQTSNAYVKLQLTAERKGRCNAVAWWFDLELDEMTTLDVGPDSAVRTWKQNLTYLADPLALEVGSQVEVLVQNHNDDQLHCFAGPPGTTEPATTFIVDGGYER